MEVKQERGMNPDSSRCSFWVEKRKRFCRMQLKPGDVYCTEHRPSTEERQPCPLDPSHTVLVKTLTEHLARCPARPRKKPVWHVAGCNCSKLSEDSWTLADVAHEEILAAVAKVQKLAADLHISQPPLQHMTHPHLEQDISRRELLGHKLKHERQYSAIIGQLASRGLLTGSRTCFVEFGAGKAFLLRAMREAVGWEEPADYVAIERTMRYKMPADKHHRQRRSRGVRYLRIVSDIADCSLSRLPLIGHVELDALLTAKHQGSFQRLICDNDDVCEPPATRIVSCSKHLCGAATDLAISSIEQLERDTAGKKQCSVFAVAICCHSKCDFDAYCNPSFIRELSLSHREFRIICLMSTWGVLASEERAASQDEDDDDNDNEHDCSMPDADVAKLSSNMGMTRGNLIQVGRSCKLLLNLGRQRKLEQLGFQVDQVQYIDDSASKENIMMVAHRA